MDSTLEQFKALFARKRAMVEKERMGFAKALHDDVSQSMTVMTIELALLQQRLGNDHPEATKVSELLDLLTTINKAVRNITNDIRPKILDEFGLVAALKYECKRLQRERALEVAFSCPVADIPLPSDIATELFRWMQFVIFELARNTRATNFQVDLTVHGDELRIQIKSNGDALSYEKLEDKDSLSLLSLEEQAAWIGAAVEISAQEKEGTSVILRLRLN